jgi:signal transduction histidine kinase
MRHFEKRRALFDVADFSFLVRLALIFAAVASAPLVRAQTPPAITNLAQITQAFVRQTQVVANVRIEATVFACSTNSCVMILQDSSGAELLELDGLKHGFQSGDRVRIESESCLLDSSDFGIYVTAAPLLNNDGLHSWRSIGGNRYFEAGRYPLRIDWFNQYSALELDTSCVATNSGRRSLTNAPAEATNLIHIVHAECFQGFWSKLPNFHLLLPVKVGNVTNFDVGFRTRDDMVGIRFDGYFDAPRAGRYHFRLRSDDGSRLWVGNPDVPVSRIGSNVPPAALRVVIGEPMASLAERRLVTIEGRVCFVSRYGKGLQFEMRSEQNSVSVVVADADALEPADLLNAYVRISGVAEGVLTESQRVVLGRLAVASSRELTIIEHPPGKAALPSVLTTVMQVQSLSRADAERQLPVSIRGVVTTIRQPRDYCMVIQDDTRGVFVRYGLASNSVPHIGELWSIAGHTQPGDFAPIIIAEKATLIGKGQMPEPAHLTWSQMVNGSMDVQWVEIQGLVTGVGSNCLSLLLPDGHQEITLPEWGEFELKTYNNAVVRIRGAMFAVWNAETHEVRSGSIIMRNASITVDKPAPDDPFDAPEKTPRGLFHFDVKATPFQRAKVRGQVTYVSPRRVFIEQGSGLQVLPAGVIKLHLGDWVETVGYPEISGDSPLLREALLRKTSDGVLPKARLISDLQLGKERLASMRIHVEGNLVGQHPEEGTMVLQIQTPANLFYARVPNAGTLRILRLGSKLALTGIYVAGARNSLPAGAASHFELLVNTPGDVAVISEPSWWTLQRLLSAIGVLLVTLALAAVWIALLRRQVAQRTLQLRHETRERERAEHQHALETERSRIARDLHDDLGSSLTEISVLANAGQHTPAVEARLCNLFQNIATKAYELIGALDVIVWAVGPQADSLQSFADYVTAYTEDFFTHTKVSSRFKVPVSFPQVTLDGRVRHALLMAVKEALNNIVRHAEATEVEFCMAAEEGGLAIDINDNGKGFEGHGVGHGLKNLQERLVKLGGTCVIESHIGIGTTVKIRLPLL